MARSRGTGKGGSTTAPSETADARFLDPALDRVTIRPDEDIDRAELVRLYRAMRLSRTFEHKLGALYRQGKIVGAVYLGMGQEAIAAGVVSLLREGDYFSTVARGLSGWFLRGVEPKHVLARWFGKDIPPGHGRELGLFLADLEQYGLAPYHNGSMASWIPSGAGFALAFKYRREPRVYAALTGEGATSPGDFYEGLNFAALHKLPLVVIVENNCFAYSTPTCQQMPVANVADRAPAFNIPAEIGFGNDIFEVRRLARRALDHARSGRGPYLIELKTFRQRGHGEHDDMAYVPQALRSFWERRDPLRLLVEYLRGEGGFTAEGIDAIDEECRTIVEAAVPYAEALPMPDPSSVTARLFAP
ncbi:MAG: thiamine pyrophosphate-dependent dehydrogenase E1 component subunit alpha [Vicinamibacterales bacterium]